MTITAFTLPPLPAPAAAPLDPEAEARAAFITGLHDLAAALENHPEIPLPYHGRLDPVTFHFLAGDNPRGAMSAAAKALGCEWREGTADYTSTGGGTYRDLNGRLHDLRLRLVAPDGGGDPDDGESAESAGETAEPATEADAETEAA